MSESGIVDAKDMNCALNRVSNDNVAACWNQSCRYIQSRTFDCGIEFVVVYASHHTQAIAGKSQQAGK